MTKHRKMDDYLLSFAHSAIVWALRNSFSGGTSHILGVLFLLFQHSFLLFTLLWKLQAGVNWLFPHHVNTSMLCAMHTLCKYCASANLILSTNFFPIQFSPASQMQPEIRNSDVNWFSHEFNYYNYLNGFIWRRLFLFGMMCDGFAFFMFTKRWKTNFVHVKRLINFIPKYEINF